MRGLLLALLLTAAPALAVTPAEMLSDPALEARAREISRGLRCPVCRNESIDDSNADISHDLRVLVRERLLAGDSDAEVIGAVVDRYGDYVLLSPRFSGLTVLLWLAGPLLLIGGGVFALRFLRGQGAGTPLTPAQLSPEEEARLQRLATRD